MATLFIGGKFQATNASGVLPGALLYTYAAGTTTPLATYTNQGGLSANTNPVVCNATGQADVWIGSSAYHMVLKDAAGVTVWDEDNIIASDGTSSPYAISGSYAVGTVGRKLRDIGISFRDYGALGDGATDDTAAINAAILAAHQAKANVLSQDETYSVVVKAEWGKDYKVTGPILLPSGIVIDLCGSRLVGTFASGQTTAYVNGSPSVIETGYYSAGAITTNRAAAVATQRVVGSGVMNGSIINANCGLNLVNFNERSFVENVSFNNCSAAIRTKGCFYSSYSRVMVRASAQASNAYAVLIDGAANAMTFKSVYVSGASRAFDIEAPTALAVSFIDCSAEGSYVTNSVGTVDGVGIYIGASAVSVAGINVSGCYFEGVRKAIQFVAGAGSYGAVFSGNFFNSCEYALLAAASAIRVGKWFSNSAPDSGGIIRNLIDVGTAIGNELDVQIQVKAGNSPSMTSAFLGNLILGNRSSADTHSFWDDTAVAGGLIARAPGSRAHLSALGDFAWEGAHMVTKNLQVPFCTQTIASTTITLDTQITYDLSNMLCCHVVISDFTGGPYTFDALIFGSTVYPLAAFTAGKGITVSNNSGNVRLVFTGLSTATYAIQGGVRHM